MKHDGIAKAALPKTENRMTEAATDEPKTAEKTVGNSYQLHDKDTGSSDVQIAALTERITPLTQHLSVHKKDFSTRRGLLKLVARRRKLLDYLSDKQPERYQKLLKDLKLRR